MINPNRAYIKQQQRIEIPSDPAAADYFGVTAATSGEGKWMVTAAPNLFLRTGRAFIFKLVNGQYQFHQELTAPSGVDENALFGVWVDMDGEGRVATVSAPFATSAELFLNNAASLVSENGATAPFVAVDLGVFSAASGIPKYHGNWALQAGASLSADGRFYVDLNDYFEVGEPRCTVSFYWRHDGTLGAVWEAFLSPANIGTGGTSLGSIDDLDTTYAQVSQTFTHSANSRYLVFRGSVGFGYLYLDAVSIKSSAGIIAVYRRDTSDVWACDESVDLLQPGHPAFGFHHRLSNDGKVVVAGMPYHDDSRGLARAHKWSGASWSYLDIQGAVALSVNTYYGRGVAISGNGDIIGIGSGGEFADLVRVDFDAGTVDYLQRVSASDSTVGHGFSSGVYNITFAGQNIELDDTGANLFISSMYRPAPDADSYSGAVYWFTADEDVWTERQILTELKPTSYPSGVVDDSAYFYGFFLSTSNSGRSVLVSCQAAQITLQDDGCAFLYDYDPDTELFERHSLIVAEDPKAYAYFAYMGVLADTYFLLGASDWDNNSGILDAGALYLFSIKPDKATLSELRTKLLSGLGFSAQGTVIPIANSFLARAQEYLYWEYEFNELRLVTDYTTGVGETLYDYHDTVHPDQIIEVRVLYNDVWIPMEEGIEYYHDTVVGNRYYPRRFDRRAQLELWPEPDAQYAFQVEHYQRLGRFTQNSDRCTVDEFLILNLALAWAKEHYGQDDAATYYKMVEINLKRRRRATHGEKRYVVGAVERSPLPKPVVVDYI